MAVLKILELVGTSKQSWSDAAREAVNEAAKTVRGIETVEVAQSKAVVQNNKLTEYQVLVSLLFWTTAFDCATSTVSIPRSEEHTSELQSRFDLVCRLL